MTIDLDGIPKFSWYPGHMLKAERELKKTLRLVDLVVEVLDARAPTSTRSKRLNEIIEKKSRIVVLNKQDLADKEITRNWATSFSLQKIPCLLLDKYTGVTSRRLLSSLIKEANRIQVSPQMRNRTHKPLRVMIVGMPNVGKSTLINQVVGRRKTVTGPFPGVTRIQQWIKLAEEIELLDTTGLTMPKIASLEIGLKLILLSIISENLTPAESVAEYLYDILREKNRQQLKDIYNIAVCPPTITDFLEIVGKKRGIFKDGGFIDPARAAKCFINDFRKGKLGILSFETPVLSRERQI